jgi:hypothetical protein
MKRFHEVISQGMTSIVVLDKLSAFPQYEEFFSEQRWEDLQFCFKQEVYSCYALTCDS